MATGVLAPMSEEREIEERILMQLCNSAISRVIPEREVIQSAEVAMTYCVWVIRGAA